MTPNALTSDFTRMQPRRELFLQEVNFQVRYNACHERAWSDSYFLRRGNAAEIGYASLKGQEVADRARASSLDDKLAFHAVVTQTTDDDTPKLELTGLVRHETDRSGLIFRKLCLNAEWLELESMLTVGRGQAELDDLPLLDANLRRIELEFMRAHCERHIGRPIGGGR
jgi:hypothetical protein